MARCGGWPDRPGRGLARDPEIATFVDSQFAGFSEIRRADLDELQRGCRPEDGLAFIEIKDQAATCLNADVLRGPVDTLRGFLALFQHVGTRYPLPRVRIAVNLLDEARVLVLPGRSVKSVPRGDDYVEMARAHGGRPEAVRHPAIFAPMPHTLFHRRLPIFSVSKIPGLHDDILLPADVVHHFTVRHEQDPWDWEAKAPRLYWRGSTTGGDPQANNWSHFPRVQLVAAAKRNRYCDMGISSVAHAEGETAAVITRALIAADLLTTPVPFARFFAYRYLYDIEGNSYSSRLPQLLASNSVVCKAQPLWVEYYYFWLRPWEHYMPMDADFLDLDAKVAFAEGHPREMRAMVERATTFTQHYLSFDFVAALVAALLWRYRVLYVP